MAYRPILCSHETIFGETEKEGGEGEREREEEGRREGKKGKEEEEEKVKRMKEYCYLKQQILSEGKEVDLA